MSELQKQFSNLSPAKRELLAQKLREKGKASPRAQTILPRERTETLPPLSFAQQRLWVLDQLEPDSSAYNIYIAMRLGGQLDIPALDQSFNEIIRRHEILRTTFIAIDGQPVQVIAEASRVRLPVIDLREFPAGEREAEVRRLAAEDSARPFDLTRGPLLRTSLLRVAEDDNVLLLTAHHIIFDGWSIEVFTREIGALYEAFSHGRPSPLPELLIQYADFTLWQREWLQGKVLQAQIDYWKKQLGDASPVLELPLDHPRPAVQTFRGERQSFSLSKKLSADLKQFSQAEGVTLFMTLLAAFQVLLYRYTNQQQISVGTAIANRNRRELEPLIGFFANTLVLSTKMNGNPPFRELLGRVQEATLGAYSHQDLPFEKVVDLLQPVRDLSYNPLFQVMFLLDTAPDKSKDAKPSGLTASSIPVDSGAVRRDLSLPMMDGPDGLSGHLEYSADLFDADTIARMIGHFRTLLESIVAHPERRIADLPLLTPVERQQLLREWTDTRKDYRRDICINELFEAQAARTPDAVAVVCGDERLTYFELNRRANQLARHLRAQGIGPDALAGIYMERSLEMVVSIIAVLKAGGAYLPIDPAYPRERRDFMLDDASPTVLLTRSALASEAARPGIKIINLDADGESIFRQADENLHQTAFAQNVAYVIYTSGSTGKPKGVAISHEALVHYAQSMQDALNVSSGDRYLHTASIAFSSSVRQLIVPMTKGATVIISSSEQTKNPLALFELVKQQAVTVIDIVPSYWRTCIELLNGLEQGARAALLDNELRLIVSASEPLWSDVPENWKLIHGASLINMFGQTETAGIVTVIPIPALDDGRVKVVPIGRPINNSQTYILDSNRAPVPVGVHGELHIGGAGLARGYLHRPDLTAEKFIPNPFSKTAGTRLYRTGDRARFLPDGSIEFVGRIDHQVKIRGFRVEPEEVEAALLEHVGVRAAVVMAREDVPGEKRLVAYLTTADNDALTTSELRQYLKEKLPEYMIPTVFMLLDALPSMPNGKVNRQALPAPGQMRPELESTFIAPRNPVEETVAEIWATILGVEQVGVRDNFFELGGHSLLATQAISRIRETFDVDVTLRHLFLQPTVEGLAECVEAARRDGFGLDMPPIETVSRDQVLPLSFGQQRLWFLDQLEPGNAFYNIPTAVRLHGTLDVSALGLTINEIVRRHEILRTTFVVAGAQPSQVIAASLNLSLPVIDLSGLDKKAREDEAVRLSNVEAQQPFDLARGPLMRVTLLRLGEDEHAVLLTMHHIVSDGWSKGVLVGEMAALYKSYLTGEPSALPELAVQYADFAYRQREWLSGDLLETQLAYWRQQLADVPPALDLPTDYPRPPIQSFDGAEEYLRLNAEMTQALKKLSRQEGATLFMTLLAAFKVLLHRYSGENHIAVGTPVAGRGRAELETLIGFFINTLVLHTEVKSEKSFRELLRTVREVCVGAYLHQDVPFEMLLEELQPERDMSRTPFFQVFFNMLNLPEGEIEIQGLTFEGLASLGAPVPANFDMTMYVLEINNAMVLRLVYNTNLFAQPRMAEMMRQLDHLLQQITERPDERVARYSLVTPESETLLPAPTSELSAKWEGAVHTIFAEHARRQPDALAVADKSETWSYAELDARTNQLANYLRDNGIERRDTVAIYGHRSAPLVWAVLGVLKAGAAFVILDPAYPASRLIDCLEIAAPRGWIEIEAAGAPQSALSEYLSSLPLCCQLKITGRDTQPDPLTAYATAAPRVEIGADDLAYVAFTSGSTGKPKGILGRHGSLSHFLPWLVKRFGLNESDRYSMLSGLSHDPLHRDIFTPLQLGAAISIPDPEEMGLPGRLARWMKQEAISIAHLTPAMAQLICESGADAVETEVDALRYVFLVGDILTRRDVGRLKQLAPSVTCVNYFGTTETQRAVGHYIIPATTPAGHARHDAAREILPLGTGIDDVQLLVLNGCEQMAGVGERGEIFVRSPHLALGYVGDEALTAAKFVVNPFTGIRGDRLYRTGDLGRYLPDGNVEALGRADVQVKIRGFRVEPGEIEASLGKYGGVREAVVIAREDEPGDKRLVAYVVAESEQPLAARELRQHLKDRLPEYMIPSAFVMLDALPLTPNGKVNRRALPAPKSSPGDSVENSREPQTPTETLLSGIWMSLLKLEHLGIDDNFFERGGHSLLATQLLSRVRETFKVEIPLRRIFETPTIAALAETIELSLIKETGPEDMAEMLKDLEHLSEDELKTLLEREGALL